MLADGRRVRSRLIRMRTREGMAAKAKGRPRGKKPKLKPRQEAHVAELYRAGGHTTSELSVLGPGLRRIRMRRRALLSIRGRCWGGEPAGPTWVSPATAS
jgi:hypothetical protein